MKKIFPVISLLFVSFSSNSQVVYTDVNPDSLVTSQYELDLNNDGTPEFRIQHIIDGGIDIVQASGVSNQDSMVGYYQGFPAVTGYPSALSSDELIDGSVELVDEGIMGGDHAVIMEDAEWPDGINRYLGLKFNISGQPHYGWAKVKISTDYVAFTIIEYAYNATAGEAINSGVTSVEENYSSVSELNIFPNPCNENATLSFFLRNESEIEVSVYDLSGKLIHTKNKGKSKPGKQVLQLNTSQWNSGIYFCRINAGNNFSTYKLSVAR